MPRAGSPRPSSSCPFGAGSLADFLQQLLGLGPAGRPGLGDHILEHGHGALDIADVQGMDGDQGYRGIADDGTEVVVRTSDGPCFDGMSGHRFPTKVELTVGDNTYDGCGAYL